MLILNNFQLNRAEERWFGAKRWRPVLHNINLALHPGELVALVGASGEGKTLLLQSLLAILPPQFKAKGELTIDDQPISFDTLPELRGKTLGYIPQSADALNPLLKVGQQIHRAATLSGKQTVHQELVSQLAHYNLPEQVLQHYPLALSGGMAKRVLVGSATLSPARFILADEVTAWLDNTHAQLLLKHFKTLCQQGRGVLWITHDLHLAARFADRIAVLHQGTIKETIRSEQLRAGQGSSWLQTLWRALPEHNFISRHSTTEKGTLAYAASA